MEAAIAKHGNLYDYRQISGRILLREPIEIVCRRHGVFTQRAQHHLSGSICKRCSLENREKSHAQRGRKLSAWKHPDAELLTYDRVRFLCRAHGEQVVSERIYRLHGVRCSICVEEIRHHRLTAFANYARQVRRITEFHWRWNRGFVDSHYEYKKRGRLEHHIDHITSIKQCFDADIPPQIAGHWCNLMLIPYKENLHKSIKPIRSPEILLWIFEKASRFEDIPSHD